MKTVETNYTNQALDYIKKNLVKLKISNSALNGKLNVSLSKLYKDFRKDLGMSIYEYILVQKLMLARDIKATDPLRSVFEVIDSIGWSLCDKTFRTRYKKQFGESYSQKKKHNQSAHEDYSECFSKYISNENERLLIEILFRIVLVTGQAKTKSYSLSHLKYIVPTTDTYFQFFVLPIEKEMVIDIQYDLDAHKLDFILYTKRVLSDGQGYIPNNTSSYLNIIQRISDANRDDIRFEVKDAIMDWKKIITQKGRRNANFFNSFDSYDFDETLKLSFNPKSTFLKFSQPYYCEVLHAFQDNIEKVMLKNFKLTSTDLRNYLAVLFINEERAILQCLKIYLGRIRSKKMLQKAVDLFIQVMQYRTSENADFKNYEFDNSFALIELACIKVNRNNLPNFIITYKNQLNALEEDVEEYDTQALLLETIDNWINV